MCDHAKGEARLVLHERFPSRIAHMARMSIRSIRYRRPQAPTWDLELERRATLDRQVVPEPWDFRAIFGREAPVEAEIGFGKGKFLLAAAQRWPERNWLGL